MATRRVALLGKPLRRRHSVVMHNAAFAAAGIDGRYELMEIDEADVPAFVALARGEDFLGLGVTAPYKPLVASLVDEVEEDANEIGAVNNVLRTDDGRLVGFNTDAPGFRAGAELAMGRPLAGVRVVVAGAGGVSRAIVHELRKAGVASLTVGNRTTPKTVSGVEAVPLDSDVFYGAIRDADLAVNATTVGMTAGRRPDPRGAAAGQRHGLRLCLRPRGDASAGGRPRLRPARGKRLRNVDRAGRNRLRALDGGQWHGRSHARGRRAAPRGSERASLISGARVSRWHQAACPNRCRLHDRPELRRSLEPGRIKARAAIGLRQGVNVADR